MSNVRLKKGATAVELVIYVAVLALILGVFFALMFSLFQTFSRVRATRASITTAQTAFERMVRESRNASEVLTDGNTLTLLREDDSEITFELTGDTLQVSIDGGSASPLTPDGVRADTLTSELITGERSQAVTLLLGISDARGSGLVEAFRTTVVLRGSYE